MTLTKEIIEAAEKDFQFVADVVEGTSDTVLNPRTGQVQKTLPAIMRDNGVRNVGLFADGVTFTAINDVAYDGDGNGWIYLGTYPFTATAGTVPSEPTYKQVSVRDVLSLTDGDKYTRGFATVSSMLSAAPDLPEGLRVEWRGYYAESDGGSNWGIIRKGDTSTVTEDGGSIFIAESGVSGTWIETNLNGYSMNVKKWGAKCNDVDDDYLLVKKAIDSGKNPVVYIPSTGNLSCFISSALYLPTGFTLKGRGSKGNGSRLKYTGDDGGAVILDATSVAKQHCGVKKLWVDCVSYTGKTQNHGIWIKGTDLTSINDWHVFEDLYITGAYHAVKVTGRCIWSIFDHIEVSGCRSGLYVTTYSGGAPSFNANTFRNFRVAYAIDRAVFCDGGQACTFITCDFEANNEANVDGLATAEFQNTESFTFINTYLENNGSGATNDRTNLATCSKGLAFTGTYHYGLKIIGGYNVSVGVPVYIACTQLLGGSISGGRMASLSGIAIYVSAATQPFNSQGQPFTIEADIKIDNTTAQGQDYIVIREDGNGKFPAWIRQSGADYFLTDAATTTLDLYRMQQVQFFSASAFNISTILNSYPGQKLFIRNGGAGSVTFAAGLMRSNTAFTLTQGQLAELRQVGYPNSRKFLGIRVIAE